MEEWMEQTSRIITSLKRILMMNKITMKRLTKPVRLKEDTRGRFQRIQEKEQSCWTLRFCIQRSQRENNNRTGNKRAGREHNQQRNMTQYKNLV